MKEVKIYQAIMMLLTVVIIVGLLGGLAYLETREKSKYKTVPVDCECSCPGHKTNNNE